MAQPSRARTPRHALRGWWKWLPFLLGPFAVLATETYLHTQRLINDYEINALNHRIEEAQRQINDLAARKASLENLKLIAARATEMRFVEPNPAQVETIHASTVTRPAEDEPAVGANLDDTLEPLALTR